MCVTWKNIIFDEYGKKFFTHKCNEIELKSDAVLFHKTEREQKILQLKER